MIARRPVRTMSMINENVQDAGEPACSTVASEPTWDLVFAEQLPRVYNFLRYRLGSETLAEDLTSLTFEKAWRHRHRYRRDLAKFSTWLLTIARNVAVDHRRTEPHHAPLEAPVQKVRLEALLGRQEIDLPKILGQQTEVLSKPGPPQIVSSPEAAGALAGMPISLPRWRPAGFELQRVQVLPGRSLRFTADIRKLQGVLDSLGIRDVSVPASIDGQAVVAGIPPIVRIAFGNGGQHFAVIESRQPVVAIPQGLDLAKLADIALRVLGVGSDQAYRIAQSVDWRTTLIVPLPADATVFRKVDVQGHPGLLVVRARTTTRGARPPESRLIWSSGTRVFALLGDVPPEELYNMAQSFQ